MARVTLRARHLASWWVASALSVATWVGDARAQGPSADRAAAEALFEQGQALLRQGQPLLACAKFETSQALEPGLGTLLFLGECRESAGQTASALRAFEQAAEMAAARGDEVRGQVAQTRAAALRPRLSHLRLRIPSRTLGLDGLEISLNGSAWPGAGFSQPAAVDPGEALVQVTAPGHGRWDTRVPTPPGPSSTLVDVQDLLPLDSPPAPGLVASSGNRSSTALREAPAGGFTVAALVLGGLGVASLATGLYFGSEAVRGANESKSPIHCPVEDTCRSSGLRLREDARKAAHRADIGVGVGATLMLSALVLYWISPSPGGEVGVQSHWSLDTAQGVALRWNGAF